VRPTCGHLSARRRIVVGASYMSAVETGVDAKEDVSMSRESTLESELHPGCGHEVSGWRQLQQ
jgi:hypothetical protein